MDKDIIEAQNLPALEKVYLKKDIFGYRIVQPIKNENGKLSLVNILVGGYRNLVFLLIILALAGFVMWSYHHDIQAIQNNYVNISADPIAWCKDVNSNPSAYKTPNTNIDFSDLKVDTK